MKDNEFKNKLNLIEFIKMNIDSVFGKKYGDIFINSPIIISAKDKDEGFQRVMVNRFFNQLLLTYRARVNKPVHNTTCMLVDDGTTEDWLQIFNNMVIPFLKQNLVFNIVYKEIS